MIGIYLSMDYIPTRVDPGRKGLQKLLKILVQAYVFPHIVYCLCVWGGAAKGQMNKMIQKLINFSARIVTGLKKNQHITPLLNSLDWPRIDALVARRDVTKVWRLLRTDSMPSNVCELLVPRSAVSVRETRSTDTVATCTCSGTAQLDSESFLVPGVCRMERAPSVCPRCTNISHL